MQKRPPFFLSLNEYVPLTFKLDEKQDRDAFFALHQRTSLSSLLFSSLDPLSSLAGDVWICKPSGLNQGSFSFSAHLHFSLIGCSCRKGNLSSSGCRRSEEEIRRSRCLRQEETNLSQTNEKNHSEVCLSFSPSLFTIVSVLDTS